MVVVVVVVAAVVVVQFSLVHAVVARPVIGERRMTNGEWRPVARERRAFINGKDPLGSWCSGRNGVVPGISISGRFVD